MSQQITSAANPLIKTLKSLHAKKGRAETGLFLAEGARQRRVGVLNGEVCVAPRRRLPAGISTATRSIQFRGNNGTGHED